AASLLTLFSTATFLLAAWWLARGLMPARLVWMAVGVLILIPGYYSPDEFFALLEGFITPRPLAQALVLCALAAWMRGFRLACAGLLFAGLLIHPIMAFSGILLLLAIWGLQHWRRLWPLAAAGLALAITAVAGWIPLDRWQFD